LLPVLSMLLFFLFDESDGHPDIHSFPTRRSSDLCEVVDCKIVPNDFHSRYTTHGKRYLYRVSRGEFVNPFKRLYTGHYKYPLDIEKIKEAMPDVEGTHDYSSFVASGSQAESHVRTI